MRDARAINWRIMSEEVRVELLIVRLEEAIEMEHTDEQKIGDVQAILRVPDGTPLGESLVDADDVPDDELTDLQLVDRMIDYHYGNFV